MKGVLLIDEAGPFTTPTREGYIHSEFGEVTRPLECPDVVERAQFCPAQLLEQSASLGPTMDICALRVSCHLVIS